MAPLPVIADTVRAAFNWEIPGGQHAVNVMHFRCTDSTAPAHIFAAIDNQVLGFMWKPLSDGAKIGSISFTPLDGTSATVTINTDSSSKWKGQESGNFIPQVAALVKLTTATRGREHRGRVFLPFVAEAVQESGAIVDDSVLAEWESGWADFIANMNNPAVENVQLVVASYKLASAGDVVAFAVERETGTQRRRQQRNR